MTKIALCIGHNAHAQGAVRALPPRDSEYRWNGRLAKMIRQLDPDQVGIFRRVYAGPGGYGAEVRKVTAQADEWGCDVMAELHFNGAYDSSATGTETFYLSEAGRRIAEKVQKAVVAALGLRDRGIKLRDSGDGAGFLRAGRAPAVILEPFFGTNVSDCRRVDERLGALAMALFTSLGGVATSPAPPEGEEPSLTLEERVARLERIIL